MAGAEPDGSRRWIQPLDIAAQPKTGYRRRELGRSPLGLRRSFLSSAWPMRPTHGYRTRVPRSPPRTSLDVPPSGQAAGPVGPGTSTTRGPMPPCNRPPSACPVPEHHVDPKHHGFWAPCPEFTQARRRRWRDIGPSRPQCQGLRSILPSRSWPAAPAACALAISGMRPTFQPRTGISHRSGSRLHQKRVLAPRPAHMVGHAGHKLPLGPGRRHCSSAGRKAARARGFHRGPRIRDR